MDEVLKKQSTSLPVVITDTAPIFCAKNKLTHKDALHILPRRKGNALSIGGLLPWVIPIRSNDMKKIPMDKIEPGMKLAKPIMSKSGMVLLSEGTELTEKWIERIQDMDVDGIFIDAPAEQTLSKEDALAQLDSRFKLLLNEPRMADIKSILRKHIEGLYG